MPWLPWSPLGCVAAFFAVLDVCQAHNPKDNPEYYVFRGDGRGPDEIREAGGFVPDPDAAIYTNPTTFSLDNHVNGRTGSSAYVSTSAEFGQAARNFAGPGNYVYRIHVTPNMIDVNAALTRGHPYPRQEEASALGGIPWTAVEGWLQLEDDREFPDDYQLLDDDSAARLTGRYVADFADQFEPNRAYDDRGLGGPARVTGTDPQVALLGAQPPDEARLINAATTFMNNHALAIGWTENQAFPYTPPTPPLSTEPVALPEADVANIPEAEREDLAEGRFDNLQCPALAVALGVTLLQPKGPNSKRYVLKSRDDKKEQCEQLRDIVSRLTFRKKQTKPAADQGGDGPQLERPGEETLEPSACNLEYIDVDFLLADERWAGTDHQLDLVLHGKFAKSASEPIRLGSDVDRGWHHTQRINLQEEFNAETISFKSINGLELWSGKDELWVQGLRLRGRCALSKHYMSVDKFSGLNEKMSAKEWNAVWTGEIKPEDWGHTRCEQIDRLELEIQLRDKAWAGTDDALDLIILGEFIGKTSHTIHMGQDMNRGWRHRERIPTSSLNGPSAFTGASDITGLELRSAAGDQIKLQSIKVTAKCADSPTEALIDHKWESINRWVKAEKESYGTIWQDAIEAKDWSWRPPCYEFDELKVAFHLVDAAWAGTDGLIQVTFDFDGPKTTLADNPNRDHRATIDINLDTVFGKKVISVDQVKFIDIWTGTDQIYIDSIQLLARCAKSGKQAVFDRYKDLDTKMSSSSGFNSVWVGQVNGTGWEAKK